MFFVAFILNRVAEILESILGDSLDGVEVHDIVDDDNWKLS